MVAVYLFWGDFIPYNGPHFLCYSALIYYLLGAIIGRLYNELKDIIDTILHNRSTVIICLIFSFTSFLFIYIIKYDFLENMDLVRNLSLLIIMYYVVNCFEVTIDG